MRKENLIVKKIREEELAFRGDPFGTLERELQITRGFCDAPEDFFLNLASVGDEIKKENFNNEPRGKGAVIRTTLAKFSVLSKGKVIFTVEMVEVDDTYWYRPVLTVVFKIEDYRGERAIFKNLQEQSNYSGMNREKVKKIIEKNLEYYNKFIY